MIRTNKPIVLFLSHNHSIVTFFKEEKRNKIIDHKLSGYGLADKSRKLCLTQCKVLLNLDDSDLIISAALRLNRKNILCPASVHPYVDFIGLDLTKPFDESSQMGLK